MQAASGSVWLIILIAALKRAYCAVESRLEGMSTPQSYQVVNDLRVCLCAWCASAWEAGLVDGSKLHVDASLIDANASKDSVIKSSPENTSLPQRARALESTL